jgi:hypothetical protein
MWEWNRAHAIALEDKTVDSPFQRSNLQRNSVWRRSKRQLRAIVHRAQQHAQGSSSAKYEEKLVQVTSNVWCTRFKVTGMSPSVLPPYLGQVRLFHFIIISHPENSKIVFSLRFFYTEQWWKRFSLE